MPHVIVGIAPSDAAFFADSCGTFTPYVAPASPAAAMGDGYWAVNKDIVPGTYDAPGGYGCYWERNTGLRRVSRRDHRE